MKHLTLILFVLLLIAGVIIYLLIRERSITQRDRTLEAREFKNKAKESLSKIEARDAQISTLLNEKDSIIKTHAESQARFKRQANVSRARVTGPPVVQDTVIIYLDSLVADLEAEKDTVYIVDNQVIDSLQKSNNELYELFKGQFKQTIRVENELRREKKKRWSLGPHGGYGFKGADVGISVQYSLLRF